MARSSRRAPVCRRRSRRTFFLRVRIAPGSGALTDMPTGLSDSASLKKRRLIGLHKNSLTRLRLKSTIGLARFLSASLLAKFFALKFALQKKFRASFRKHGRRHLQPILGVRSDGKGDSFDRTGRGQSGQTSYCIMPALKGEIRPVFPSNALIRKASNHIPLLVPRPSFVPP
jgi:hypothetical protein